MKPLQKIKRRDGKIKEWRGIGAVTNAYLDFLGTPSEVILIAGDRETLRKAFFRLCGNNANFRVGKLRRVKVTKP